MTNFYRVTIQFSGIAAKSEEDAKDKSYDLLKEGITDPDVWDAELTVEDENSD